jgi:hypothetical protein
VALSDCSRPVFSRLLVGPFALVVLIDDPSLGPFGFTLRLRRVILVSQSSKRTLSPISASAASCLRRIDYRLLWMLTLGRLPFWGDYRQDRLARHHGRGSVLLWWQHLISLAVMERWLWHLSSSALRRRPIPPKCDSICDGLDVAQLEKLSLEDRARHGKASGVHFHREATVNHA